MSLEGKHWLELSRPVFLALTLTCFPPSKNFTKCIETKVEAEILKKLTLNVFSWFCLPLFKGVAASCFSIISSELWTGHPQLQPVKYGVVSCPVSDLVSSFCSRAVWHEIAGVGEEQNAVPQLKETQPTSSFLFKQIIPLLRQLFTHLGMLFLL